MLAEQPVRVEDLRRARTGVETDEATRWTVREFTETMETWPLRKIESGFIWDGKINSGFYYLSDSGEMLPFVGEDGRHYQGLLNGSGKPLKHNESVHILWFKVSEYNTPAPAQASIAHDRA